MTTVPVIESDNKAIGPVADAFRSIVMPNISEMSKTFPFEHAPMPSLSAALDISGIDSLGNRLRHYNDCGPCNPSPSSDRETTVSHARVDLSSILSPDRMRLLNDIRRIRRSIGPVSRNVAETLRELRENGD